ncbi:G patch domain-containing protein 11-like [Hibiscus syriacus]|uniref:G patch domain-containing protein 11-like n=1 Tax=Hibiscus syriacus TaxID=106335 RepID=UPI001923F3F7|nr:G patch domain-containing protein 11-like [Hibiscus syriacus]
MKFEIPLFHCYVFGNWYSLLGYYIFSNSLQIPNNNPLSSQPFKKKSKKLIWQEQRKLERERKQLDEDEQTLAKIDAPIPQSNIDFKLLKQMGYTPGSALGKEASGRAEPVGLDIRRSRAGIGRDDPLKEKRKREEIEFERKRKNEEALMEEFGSWQKSQWRSRRVVVNYKKAKAALDQLENKEIVVPKKNDEEEGDQEEEEEEEVVTGENLQDILMKLREEYQYCPFCGFQYESMEALFSSCPGTNEDDH